MNKNWGVPKLCKFHDPQGRGCCAWVLPYKSYCEKCIISLKIFISTPEHRSGKVSKLYTCSNDDQRMVYQNGKFYDPLGQRLCWGMAI